MKPTYTVRLTGPLDPDERMRVAQRVAGTTDIDAQKIARLLDRGEGRDLIKPSSANVANRLASVLAEAGAPVQLVPVAGEPVDAAAGQQSGAEERDDHVDEGLRPRQAGVAAPRGPSGIDPAGAGAQAARPDESAVAEVGSEVDGPARVDHEAISGAGARAAGPADAMPAGAEVPGAEPMEPDRTSGGAEARDAATGGPEVVVGEEEATPPPSAADEPARRAPASPEPAVPEAEPPDREGAARSEPRRGPQPITQPQRSSLARNGTAFLGAVGAAVLGIGAFLAMDFLLGPIAIGVLVLAALALVLSLAGQRRTVWLPGLGSIALLVWALVNAEGGALASLAANWTWFAMFAGALLLIVAGLQESQRRRAA